MLTEFAELDCLCAADGVYFARVLLGSVARHLGVLLAVAVVFFVVPAGKAEVHFLTVVSHDSTGLFMLPESELDNIDETDGSLVAHQEMLQEQPVGDEVLPPSPAEKTFVPAADPCEKQPAAPGPKPVDLAKALNPSTVCDDPLTFTPGVRIQPRYEYDANFSNNDFFIRRFRLKGSGSAYGVAKYGVELKIDNTNRFEANPTASVENAWLDFPVVVDSAYLRAGLYDIPISRNALTSDSKLLLMDRSLIKEALTGIGFADNTVGVMLHGRPYEGLYEYDIGVFDNVFFEKVGAAGTRQSDELMPAGRFMVCLMDPAGPPEGYADYKESYLGQGQRLDIAVNGGHLGDAFDAAIEYENISALGGDLFFNSGRYVFQTEFDWFVEDLAGGGEIVGDGWYVQGGYLLGCLWHSLAEAVVRYQTLDLDTNVDTLRWTSMGMNFYIREHNLKVQTDYTFRDGGLLDDDVFAVQLQLEF
jgi:Phosphate-selective porin O and P